MGKWKIRINTFLCANNGVQILFSVVFVFATFGESDSGLDHNEM